MSESSEGDRESIKNIVQTRSSRANSIAPSAHHSPVYSEEEEFTEKKTLKFVSLRNQGNTCYINSALQML